MTKTIKARKPMSRRSRNRGKVESALKVWHGQVLARWKGLCAFCSKPAYKGHHIYSQQAFPHLRLCVNNGIALCQNCHTGPDSVHDKPTYGLYRILRQIGQPAADELYRLAFRTGKGKA